MWYKTCIPTILALALGCGDGGSPSTADLTASVTVDLSPPADMLVADGPDMTSMFCATPKPGLYSEIISYSFVPVVGGGSPQNVASNTTMAVRGDGALVRLPGPAPDATRFHCAFTFDDVDKKSCLVPCCPGQTASPTVFVSSGGWVMWLGGTCTFATASGVNFAATTFDIQGYFNR